MDDEKLDDAVAEILRKIAAETADDDGKTTGIDHNGVEGPPLAPIVGEGVGFDLDRTREIKLKAVVAAVAAALDGQGPQLAVTEATYKGDEVVVLSVIVPEGTEGIEPRDDQVAVMPVAILLGEGHETGLTPINGEKVMNPNYQGGVVKA